jgi:hypothetical protein
VSHCLELRPEDSLGAGPSKVWDLILPDHEAEVQFLTF